MAPWRTIGPAMLTPGVALQILRDGNARFVRGETAGHDIAGALKITAQGQAPFATFVSCIDSRVPVEMVFDLSIGHAFSARVAGNVIGPDVIGSLEFATAVAGSRLVVILGHTSCGAVKGACDHVELGNLTSLLKKIEPAVTGVGRSPAGGGKPSEDTAFVDAVATLNVSNAIDELLAQSEIIRDLADTGTVGVVGAMYDVSTGEVTFTDGVPLGSRASATAATQTEAPGDAE